MTTTIHNFSGLLRVLLCLASLMLSSHAVHGANDPDGQDVDEAKLHKVEAAFLINFIKFTTWPDASFTKVDTPISVTVLGEDEYGAVLDALAERAGETRGRTITVERVTMPQRKDFASVTEYDQALEALVAELKSTHLLMMNGLTQTQVDAVIEGLKDEAVLTVGSKKSEGERGAMLSFGVEKGKVCFYANTDRIDKSPLKIDSKMLRLARVIESQ